MNIRSTLLFPIILSLYFLSFFIVTQFTLFSSVFLRILFWNSTLYVVGIAIVISVVFSSFKVTVIIKELKYILFCLLVIFFLVFNWSQVILSKKMDISKIIDTNSSALIEKPRPSARIEFFVPLLFSSDDKETNTKQIPTYFGQYLDGTMYQVYFGDTITLDDIQDSAIAENEDGIFLQWQNTDDMYFLNSTFLSKLLVNKNILTNSYSNNIYVQFLLFLCLVVFAYVSIFLIGYSIELYFVRVSFVVTWMFFVFWTLHQSTQGFWYLVIGTVFFLVINIILIITMFRLYSKDSKVVL